MKKYFILLLILGLSELTFSDWNDSFTSNESISNWSILSDSVTTNFNNGKFYVSNRDSKSSAILRHDKQFDKGITFSVKFDVLNSTYALPGLMFCGEASKSTGYIFSITSNQEYTLYKYSSSGLSIIKFGRNSYINKVTNTLKISRDKDSLYLFCNDVFLSSVADTEFSNGWVGLFLGPKDSVAYDEVKVLDHVENSSKILCYQDDFNDGNTNGWAFFDNNSNAKIVDGALELSNSSGSKIMFVTNGEYKNAPVKVIANRVSGNGAYGLILMDINVELDSATSRNVTSFNSFVFSISKDDNGNTNYMAYKFSSGDSSKWSVNPNSNITGDVDTLEITSDYKFLVNGNVMPDVDFGKLNFDFNAVGFIIDSNVTVRFDNFSAGDTACVGIAVNHARFSTIQNKKQTFTMGGVGILYDSRGRKIASSRLYKMDSLANIGSGKFYFIPNGNKQFKGRQAVIKFR